jgi:hypothetical protein
MALHLLKTSIDVPTYLIVANKLNDALAETQLETIHLDTEWVETTRSKAYYNANRLENDLKVSPSYSGGKEQFSQGKHTIGSYGTWRSLL